MQRCCWLRGKKMTYRLLCSDWLVARCPAYVCCRLNTPEFMCRATRRLLL